MAHKTPYRRSSNHSSNESPTKIHSGPKTVTEWNVQRLALAGGLLMTLILIGYLSFTGEDQTTSPSSLAQRTESLKPQTNTTQAPPPISTPTAAVTTENPTDNTVQFKLSDAEKVMTSQEMSELKNTIRKENNQAEKDRVQKTRDASEKSKTAVNPSSKLISRSFLARRIVNKEPSQLLDNTIKITKGQSITINYFTEIKDMKGKAVYHEWTKNNRTVFRRRIHITGDRWRASSRKVFNRTSAGEWQARTVDERNQVIDRKNFTIHVSK